jgi:hypothetical protein
MSISDQMILGRGYWMISMIALPRWNKIRKRMFKCAFYWIYRTRMHESYLSIKIAYLTFWINKINWNLLLELDNSPFSSQFKWFQYWKLYCKWLKTENKTKVNIKVLLNMINISLFNGNLRLIYHPYLSTSLILFSTWRPYSNPMAVMVKCEVIWIFLINNLCCIKWFFQLE